MTYNKNIEKRLHLLRCALKSLQYISKTREYKRYQFIKMNNTKIISCAQISLSTPSPTIQNGEVVFIEATESYCLENFEVPSHVVTENDIKAYLNSILEDAYLASVDSVTL